MQTYDMTIAFAGIEFRTIRSIEDKKEVVVDEWDIERLVKTGNKIRVQKHYEKERLPMTAIEIVNAIVTKTSFSGHPSRFIQEFVSDINAEEGTNHSIFMNPDEFVMLLTRIRDTNTGLPIAKLNEPIKPVEQPKQESSNLPTLW